MKTKNNFHSVRLAIWLSALFVAGQALADVVYVTARPTPTGAGANPALNANFENVYSEITVTLDNTSARSTVADAPARDGSRYYQFSAPLTNTAAGFTLRPDLGTPGGIYLLQHSLNPNAGNVNTNSVFSVSSTNATLSVTNTTVFQRTLGNTWKTIGHLTNAPGSSNPVIDFRYESGFVSAAAPGNRLLLDVFRFSLFDPCQGVPVPTVQGPLATNLPDVAVAGVTNIATAVAVYQDSGSGMVKIGELTNGIVGGVNLVPVTGLVKNARVAATQTVEAQESCVPTTGLPVGGGANPRIRAVLSIRETDSTGPVGAPGNTVNNVSTNIHFLGASFRTGGAPGDGTVVNPSTSWQTLAFDADLQAPIGNVGNAAGSVIDGFYNPSDTVQVRVYAFTNDPITFVTYYSRVGAATATLTSNDLFGVEWTWDAVPGAEGYRLLRSTNSAGFAEYLDIYGFSNLTDLGFGWTAGNTVIPSSIQSGPSVQWNSAVAADVGKTNNIGTPWGILEAIAFAIDDLGDTGPFDLYLDNFQNGATVWQDFESFVAGTTDAGFRAPGFSGTTSGNLLGTPNPAPNEARVSNAAADTGTKSIRVRFQWAGTNATQWLRLTTSGVGNPLVNLEDPTSFRILLLPVNATPVAPSAPSLSIKLINGEAVLDWEGAHTLQEADAVTGPFAPVPGPVILGPYTNTPAGDGKFFRLVN